MSGTGNPRPSCSKGRGGTDTGGGVGHGGGGCAVMGWGLAEGCSVGWGCRGEVCGSGGAGGGLLWGCIARGGGWGLPTPGVGVPAGPPPGPCQGTLGVPPFPSSPACLLPFLQFALNPRVFPRKPIFAEFGVRWGRSEPSLALRPGSRRTGGVSL